MTHPEITLDHPILALIMSSTSMTATQTSPRTKPTRNIMKILRSSHHKLRWEKKTSNWTIEKDKLLSVVWLNTT